MPTGSTSTVVSIEPPMVLRPAQSEAVTGHQAWLWHPGILVKYLLAAALSQKSSGNDGVVSSSSSSSSGGSGSSEGPGGWRHVVVDHGVYHPWSLDLPFRDGDRLFVKTFRACSARPGVPAALYPAVQGGRVAEAFIEWVDRVDGTPCFDAGFLAETWRQVADAQRLVDQTSELIRLSAERQFDQHAVGAAFEKQAWPKPMGTLGGLPAGLIERVLQDPWRVASAWHQALREHPHTGLRPLHAGVDIVELPLWFFDEAGLRHRVLAQVTGGRFDCLTAHGRRLDVDAEGTRQRLAPNAVMLTAWQRSIPGTSVFIHGTGGGDYDQATAAWWRSWTGGELAPIAVATADVYRSFDVPLSTPTEHERAVWAAHHAPFNLDRLAGLDDVNARRKQTLLKHMDDDRDPARRRAAFDEIHALNAAWQTAHADLLSAARRRVDQTAVGVANAAIASRRDWFFGLYPAAQIRGLAEQLFSQLGSEGADRDPPDQANH